MSIAILSILMTIAFGVIVITAATVYVQVKTQTMLED